MPEPVAATSIRGILWARLGLSEAWHDVWLERLAEEGALSMKRVEEGDEMFPGLRSLYYVEEMNLKEIGAILNVSESRVSQIISETAKKLRGLMNS